MSNNYEYYCTKCNYGTNRKCDFDRHCKTTLHITGKRKIRFDKQSDIYKCEKCEYETNNKHNLISHTLNNHHDENERNKLYKYFCSVCNFGANVKSIYDKHLNTKKHKRFSNL
jgi:hypothetical protein